jgi:hypothetical protein
MLRNGRFALDSCCLVGVVWLLICVWMCPRGALGRSTRSEWGTRNEKRELVNSGGARMLGCLPGRLEEAGDDAVKRAEELRKETSVT